MIAKLGNLQPG